MTTFDEAARKAADEMGYLYELSSEEEVARIITKHFADLASLQENLVKLVDLKHKKIILVSAYMTPMTYAEMSASEQGFDLNVKIGVIERDPQVAALIERMKG